MKRYARILILAILMGSAAVFWWSQPKTGAPLRLPIMQPPHTGQTAPDTGAHGGKLLARDDLRFEIMLPMTEPGTPPRLYVTASRGAAVDPRQISAHMELHRPERVDTVHFHAAEDSLLGDAPVAPPRAFTAKLHVEWNGKSYSAEFTENEDRVQISAAAASASGITYAVAGPATLKSVSRLPGAVRLNEEKIAHLIPRLNGVIREVYKHLGDHVRQGETIAIIESKELAEAKNEYLKSWNQRQLATVDLEREKTLFSGMETLFALLRNDAGPEQINAQLRNMAVDEARALVIPAFHRLRNARATYLREKSLHEKKISAESEYLLALQEFNIAEANYTSLLESTAFAAKRQLMEKERAAQNADLTYRVSKQRLMGLGVTTREIDAIASGEPGAFTRYELRAPIDGHVVQKHLAIGEAVKSDADILLLADLSQVWVDITIPTKDLPAAALGQKVKVTAEKLGLAAEGVLTYLGPVVDENTRAVTGRVVIPNPDLVWRPGLFVAVELTQKERAAAVAMAASAVQSLRGRPVAFVKFGGWIEARPLQLGESDGQWVEVLSGLAPGQEYAAANSFIVKAEMGRSSMIHEE